MTRAEFEINLRSQDAFARGNALLGFSKSGGILSSSRLLHLYLNEPQPFPRTCILRFLIDGSRANSDFETTLLNLLKESNDARKLEVFAAMTFSRRYPERLKEAIISIAVSSQPPMKAAAIDVLMNYFPHRIETIRFVHAYLDGVDKKLRCLAAAFLILHAPAERDDAMRVIRQQLESPDGEDRLRMVLSLNHPLLVNRFREDLLPLIEDENPAVQRTVATLYWESDLRCNSLLFPNIKPMVYRI